MNELRVRTNAGTLIAVPSNNPEHPGICLMFEPNGCKETCMTLFTQKLNRVNMTKMMMQYMYMSIQTSIQRIGHVNLLLKQATI